MGAHSPAVKRVVDDARLVAVEEFRRLEQTLEGLDKRFRLSDRLLCASRSGVQSVLGSETGSDRQGSPRSSFCNLFQPSCTPSFVSLVKYSRSCALLNRESDALSLHLLVEGKLALSSLIRPRMPFAIDEKNGENGVSSSAGDPNVELMYL